MNHRTKTSLSITVQPDETALVQLKWSSKDQLRPKEEVAKDLLSHLINLPDYLWLRPFFDKEVTTLSAKADSFYVHARTSVPRSGASES